MAKRRSLKLSVGAREELERVRDRHKKAYMREKATALLKIDEGISPHAVARKGLLKERDPDSVYGWLSRYEAEGVAGLEVRSGRGRKPAFSP
jgi:transposase